MRPSLAPPLGPLEAFIAAQLSRLAQRLRGNAVRQLAARLSAQLRPGPQRLDDPAWLLEAVQGTLTVLELVEEEVGRERAAHTELREVFFGLQTDAERRALLAEYLRANTKDRGQLRGDLRALDRFLGIDVIAERHQRTVHELDTVIEVGLHFVGGAAERALELAPTTRPELLRKLLSDAELDQRLLRFAEHSRRWQNSVAALEALTKLFRHLAKAEMLDLAVGEALRRGLASALRSEGKLWVQTATLELLLVATPKEGLALLGRRLLSPPPASKTDFLLRGRAVALAATTLERNETLELFARVIERRDPSEHVRQCLVEALAELGGIEALRLLEQLSSLREPTPRVRARAVIAMSRLVRSSDDRDLGAEVARVFGALLAIDPSQLVLSIATQEAGDLAIELGAAGRAELVAVLAARLDAPLDRLAASSDRGAAVQEAAAATAERFYIATDARRLAWRMHLAKLIETMKPGAGVTLLASELGEPLGDEELGRVLADLSRDDYGLSITKRGRRLRLWRGDRFLPQLWRIWHESRHPAPTKRQAHTHAIGRVPRGELRAPPSRLDEVTATTVPGERMTIEREGSWGRHVPLVDDLLHLPVLRRRPVAIFSSHGITRVVPAARLVARAINYLKISRDYAALDRLRRGSLDAVELRERFKFLEHVARRYGIETRFEGYDAADPSPELRSLFTARAMPLAAPVVPWVEDWLREQASYLLRMDQNSQSALALFTGSLLGFMMISSYRSRARIARARAAIPLSIGGWGTRGKSGTERLKAGLFHGLGYQVLVKTTGCEAMFIHAVPEREALEVFIYRPYDKATIWEQGALVQLGAQLETEVFLWECMALNPRYVELLQDGWMRDDLATLTNAFPDHEDIQGPAGHDVASVISNFIPSDTTVYTTEVSFLPILKERAKERRANLVTVHPREGDLIAEDLLALFPYQEHPRNIALVTKLAMDLGLERTMAIVTMAQYVVPDLGVLKTYPAVRVRGRVMRFVNGMSANERTGTLNNWRRVGCDEIDSIADPARAMVTVVNNRQDRVSRSEVFGRLLVEDLSADRHIFIGTNLRGLRGYAEAALGCYVATIEVVRKSDASDADAAENARKRLADTMRRLRVAPPDPAAFVERLRTYAAGANLVVADDASVREVLAQAFASERLPQRLEESSALARATVEKLRSVLAAMPSAPPHDGTPEVMAAPTADDVLDHFARALARTLLRARLERTLEEVLDGRGDGARIHAELRPIYGELFMDLLVIVERSSATGDQVIDTIARAVPPGVQALVMGIQNIKGTGLDFVYRWLALQRMVDALDALGRPAERVRALDDLERMEDQGLIDAGLAKKLLPEISMAGWNTAERAQHARVLRRNETLHEKRMTALATSTGGGGFAARALDWFESTIDYLDSMRRRRQAMQVLSDLVNRRISLTRAMLEMRRLTQRQKGGWLAKGVLAKKES